MVDSSQIQAYLNGVSRRYGQWRRDNALTEIIADQQEAFTFQQFVQTEERQSGDPINLGTDVVKPPGFVQTEERQSGDPSQKEIKTYPLFEGIYHYLLEKSEHVLLVGSPGVGKSSALWHCLDTLAKEELEASGPRIPVLIQLKAYRDSFISAEDPYGLLTLIKNSLRPRLQLSLAEIDNLLRDQQLILLLDGLNEIPTGVFCTHLQQFRDECRELEVPLICSTREMGGGDLGIQRKLEIQPLNLRETDRFLQECLPEHQDQVRQLLQRDNRDLSRTPFILWMLYHLLKETGTIAETLGEAFRQFFRFHCRNYKEDAPVSEERRKAWNLWMEHLAFTMLSSPDPLDSGLVIAKEKAENILAERFDELQGGGSRILELEKYYLLAPASDRETSFKHQLIQEYYAAEYLLEKLKDEPHILQSQPNHKYTSFQINYLNHLKWTEPLLILMALLDSPTSRFRDPQDTAIQISKLALTTDLRLGSRIIGATSKSLQEHTVKLLLEKDCQDSLKIWLLQQSQSVQSIPFLLNILHDGDSNHRWRAARALAKFDKNLVKGHLIRALKDSDASTRRMAAVSLKELCSEDMVANICELLGDDDWLVCSSAINYLGSLQGEESERCLIHGLSHGDSIIRRKAAEYLGIRAPKKVINILKIKLEEGSESQKIAIDLLGETRSNLAFPLLVKSLSSKDWIIRSNAIDSIGLLGVRLGMYLPEEVVDELISVLQNDTEATVRSGAAIHLGFAKNFRALPSLIQALSQDKHMVVRRSVACALGKLQSLTAEQVLIEHLKDDEIVVKEVIRSLRLLCSRKALCYIKRFLNSKNPELRKEAVLSIGILGDSKKDSTTLYKFLKDKDFSVRLCSAYALSQFGNRKGIPILKEALETGNQDARRRAFYGMRNFNGKIELSTVTSIAIKDEEYSLRKEAIKFLKNFSHTQEVRDRLSRGIKSNDETISRQATDAARILGHPETLGILNQILQEIEVVETPLEAIQGIQSRYGFYNHHIYLQTKCLTKCLISFPEKIESGLERDIFKQKEYERILTTLRHMVNVMERNPSTFFNASEEALRDHFLVQLNGIYEGQATGETVNHRGKTDILVRLRGENVFIGECKFWGGESKLKETLDQLLGYATWHDNRLGMLIFNRNKNFSAVLNQVPNIIKQHSSFLKEETHSETQFHFIVKHPDDPQRELKLAVLAFDIPTSST